MESKISFKDEIHSLYKRSNLIEGCGQWLLLISIVISLLLIVISFVEDLSIQKTSLIVLALLVASSVIYVIAAFLASLGRVSAGEAMIKNDALKQELVLGERISQ